MTIRLWPRSLFGRLALLLLLVILVSQATAIYLFRQDRAALLARQFSDTKIVQLKALRAGLAAAAPTATSATLAQFGEVYQARIVPADERRFVGGQPQNRVLLELQERLKAELGPQTEVRIQPRLQLLWIKLQAGAHAYWAGFQLTPRPGDDAQSRAVEWSLIALVVLLASAFAFARYLARPLRQLSDAVSNVGRGQSPAPLPETGPSEIVSLNRGFNQMLASLHQAEQDRALLLAGVSHDLRTPLSRLRLAVEVGTRDERERAAMVGDIEEIDKIIGQFLDFARDQRDAPLEPRGLNDIVADVVERYRRGGGDVRFAAGEIPMVALRPTAMSRLIVNLTSTGGAGRGRTRDLGPRPGHTGGPGRAAEAPVHAGRAGALGRRRRGAGTRHRRSNRPDARRQLRPAPARGRRCARACHHSPRQRARAVTTKKYSADS